MTQTQFTQPHPAILDALRPWLTRISQPDHRLNRTGPVCPFVPTALRDQLITTVSWAWPHTTAHGAHQLQSTFTAAMNHYEESLTADTDDQMESLIVVIDGMPEEAWPLIDTAHPAVKPHAVQRGLMLGQFHPACPTPSAHNPSFLVNQSPLPLIVVRRIALHDLLFLHTNPDHFASYQARFDHRFTPPSRPPAHLAELYQQASDRHRRWPTEHERSKPPSDLRQ